MVSECFFFLVSCQYLASLAVPVVIWMLLLVHPYAGPKPDPSGRLTGSRSQLHRGPPPGQAEPGPPRAPPGLHPSSPPCPRASCNRDVLFASDTVICRGSTTRRTYLLRARERGPNCLQAGFLFGKKPTNDLVQALPENTGIAWSPKFLLRHKMPSAQKPPTSWSAVASALQASRHPFLV